MQSRTSLIRRDPARRGCRGGSGRPQPPVVTIAQATSARDAIEPRFRAIAPVAAFAGLRLGELQALTRERAANLLHAEIRLVERLHELRGGKVVPVRRSRRPARAWSPSRGAEAGARASPRPVRRSGPDRPALLWTPGPTCPPGQPRRGAGPGPAGRRGDRAGLRGSSPHRQHLRRRLGPAPGADGQHGTRPRRAAAIYQYAVREREHAIAQALYDMIEATGGGQAVGCRLVRQPLAGQGDVERRDRQRWEGLGVHW